MLANKPLNFQKGIEWVARAKPEMGRRVLLESVNGKCPPVTWKNLHTVSVLTKKKTNQQLRGEHFNYLPEIQEL